MRNTALITFIVVALFSTIAKSADYSSTERHKSGNLHEFLENIARNAGRLNKAPEIESWITQQTQAKQIACRHFDDGLHNCIESSIFTELAFEKTPKQPPGIVVFARFQALLGAPHIESASTLLSNLPPRWQPVSGTHGNNFQPGCEEIIELKDKVVRVSLNIQRHTRNCDSKIDRIVVTFIGV